MIATNMFSNFGSKWCSLPMPTHTPGSSNLSTQCTLTYTEMNCLALEGLNHYHIQSVELDFFLAATVGARGFVCVDEEMREKFGRI